LHLVYEFAAANNSFKADGFAAALTPTIASMKNIQAIDGADNCSYDIYAATEAEFSLILPAGTDIAFSDEVWEREEESKLKVVFEALWQRPVKKEEVQGIHGTLFYQMPQKKNIYPTRRWDGESLEVKLSGE
jgi:hypothetical protein